MGVNQGYIGQRCRGGGAQSDASAKHARFAAACALNALLCEQNAWIVEQKWGLPSTLTQQGQIIHMIRMAACMQCLVPYI